MSKFPDTVERTIKVLRDTFGNEFKTYYNGDPEALPSFNLPAIIVDQTNDETQQGAMGEDDVTDSITVKVVLDKREDFTGSVDPLNTTAKRIRDYISKRDPVTGEYDRRTVKHAIRSKLLDDDLEAVANSMSVQYGINPRPVVGDNYAELTAEGHVSFTVQYSISTY